MFDYTFKPILFYTSFCVIVTVPTVLVCLINGLTAGRNDTEEGFAEQEAQELDPVFYALSVCAGFSLSCFAIFVPLLLEWALIALFRYLDSDELRKKEAFEGKVYLDERKNEELIERFANMTEAEKEQWYADYVKRLPDKRPAASVIKRLLILWGVGLLLGIGFKALVFWAE